MDTWDKTPTPIKIADCYSWIRYFNRVFSDMQLPSEFPAAITLHPSGSLGDARHETQNRSD